MRFVDSHLHLDGPDASALVSYASAAEITLFACGVDQKSSTDLVILAGTHPSVVRPFVGIHPSEALKAHGLEWLNAAAGQAAGVGEIGLDPSYSPSGTGSVQRSLFESQLEAAQAGGLPVQVHSRGAEAECVQILGTFSLKTVLMHWLESEDALSAVRRDDYFVSVGPALLYSKRLQRIALRLEPSRTLLESDSPVGYGPLDGRKGPSLIPSVAFKLAELWGRPFDEVLEGASENAMGYLGLPRKVNHVRSSGLNELG